MHDDNKNNPHPNAHTNARTNTGTTPPDHLLDELTSIKDLLGGEHAGATLRPEDIPVLDDVVGTAQPHLQLFDIDRIFADDATPEPELPDELPFPFPTFTLDVALSDAPAPAAPAAMLDDRAGTLRANYRRELLIQELVDEFLPRIEAELRERLGRLDPDALQSLARRD